MTTELKWTKELLRKEREMTEEDYNKADTDYLNGVLTIIGNTNKQNKTELIVTEYVLSNLRTEYRRVSHKIDRREDLSLFTLMQKLLNERTDFDTEIKAVESRYDVLEYSLVIDWSVE